MAKTPAKPADCPICAKPVVERYRPFCSKRCADVDLARWLGGTYRIPTEEMGLGEEEPGAVGGLESPDSWEKQD